VEVEGLPLALCLLILSLCPSPLADCSLIRAEFRSELAGAVDDTIDAFAV
ncbi:unnamed protein product, partial [marine sediment metagenome]